MSSYLKLAMYDQIQNHNDEIFDIASNTQTSMALTNLYHFEQLSPEIIGYISCSTKKSIEAKK